jgi:hypothetical protein
MINDRVAVQHEGTTLQNSKEFNFAIGPYSDYFVAFPTDGALVIDASVQVQYKRAGEVATITENLNPKRHGITLPINGLNALFTDIQVSVNQTLVNQDRQGSPPPPHGFSPTLSIFLLQVDLPGF